MPTPKPPLRYCAFLLRCWVEHSGRPEHPLIWRFSLEDPHTGVRHGFADFEQLLTYLRAELHDAPLTTVSDEH